MREDFHNTNGLVDGRIPKGVQCPFKDKCIFATYKAGVVCRRPDVMDFNFSCASARAFSLIANSEREKENG